MNEFDKVIASYTPEAIDRLIAKARRNGVI